MCDRYHVYGERSIVASIVVLAVGNGLSAEATFAANFEGEHVSWGDIRDLPDSMTPPADVLVGVPSCQSLSNLGTKDPEDPRNSLWREYVRVLVPTNPACL